MWTKVRHGLTKMKTIDYRHYINVAITLCFIACGVFLFPNAILRIAESVRDFATSFAYTVADWFLPENNVTPTVNTLPKWQFTQSHFEPLDWFAYDKETFIADWKAYWALWANWKTFLLYCLVVLRHLTDIYIACVLLFFTAIPLYILLRRYVGKYKPDYDVESKSVITVKLISDYTYRPIKKWIAAYIAFLRENSLYVKVWLALWGLYLNVFTIAIEGVAYFIYVLSSFDFISIYIQLYKLSLDLTAAVRFIPLFLWICGVIGVLEYWARQVGYNRLERRECRNVGFIRERGVVTIVYGPMGSGKTKLITDMALTEEVRQRDMAFEIIIESDFKFPNMNWATLEQELKAAIAKHKVFSVPTVRKWLRKKYRSWVRKPCRERIFGYDYERYGLTYNDALKVSNVWEVIDDYACAYFVYTVQSSLLIANYSIRTDNLLEDIGNFPLWNTSFFRRDSRLMDSYSRHAHILDFDMLRLGKRLVENNPNRYAFGFGVYVISEIDKERKNDKELRDAKVQATDEKANQRNDLFNMLLKMARHRCVIANRVFVKVFADLQRPESLGADARELGEVHYIEEGTEMQPILPLFSPFYFVDFVFSWLFGKVTNLYYKYRFNRSDKTLPLYAVKNFTAWVKKYTDRTSNTFNSSAVKLKVESGRMDGQAVERKYFLQAKKIYAKRYATDCLSGIFEEYSEKNIIGIDDMPEYMDIIASEDELLMQNSFFQLEVRGLNAA